MEDAVGHRYYTDKQIFRAKLENFLSRKFVPGGYYGEQAPEKSIEEAVAQLTKNFEESLAEESGIDPEKITEITEKPENQEVTKNSENQEVTENLNDSENPEVVTLATSPDCVK